MRLNEEGVGGRSPLVLPHHFRSSPRPGDPPWSQNWGTEDALIVAEEIIQRIWDV